MSDARDQAPSDADVGRSGWDEAIDQFVRLVEAGVSLPEALRVAGDSAEQREIAGSLNEIAARLDDGLPLGEAVRHSSLPSASVMAATLEAGELVGSLSEVLRPVIATEQMTAALAARFRRGLLYPITVVVLGVICSVTAVLITGEQVTAVEQSVSPSAVLARPWWVTTLLVLPVAALFLAMVEAITSWTTRRPPFWWLPSVRAIVDHLTYHRWTQITALLVERGVAMPTALAVAGEAAGERVARQTPVLIELTQQGVPVADVFARLQHLPPVARVVLDGLTARGEATHLARRLRETATLLHEATRVRIDRFARTQAWVTTLVLSAGLFGYAMLLFGPYAQMLRSLMQEWPG